MEVQQTPQPAPGAGRDLELLRRVKALISDLDGTLLAGSKAQAGLPRFVAHLRRLGIALTVVTNNTVRTPEEYSRKLAAAGAHVPPDEILTAAGATAAYLTSQLPQGAPLFVVGESGLKTALLGAGFVLVEDSAQDTAAVVVGGDRNVDHAKLKHAIRLVRRGARFVGTNPDLLVPVEDGLAPEAGVLLAAIGAGAGVSPTIIGKPERPLLEQAIARLGSAPATTAILGDRLSTDILGGQRLGLITILVTTGVDSAPAGGITPDLVVDGLNQLADLWEQAMMEVRS